MTTLLRAMILVGYWPGGFLTPSLEAEESGHPGAHKCSTWVKKWIPELS